jgi:hypothetical protein
MTAPERNELIYIIAASVLALALIWGVWWVLG